MNTFSPDLNGAAAIFSITAAFSLYGFTSSASAVTALTKQLKESDKEPKKVKKPKKSSTAPKEAGAPALWEDRGNISRLDLIHGIGNDAAMPKPPFRFDKEDVSGSNPKIKVIDANDVKWNVKFDEEVHAEVASTRIAWACGYMVEENYLITSGKVDGVTGLSRAKKFIGRDGSFTNGMFEKRPANIARRGINWSWESNPFTGTKELKGLIVLMALLNNWDLKDSNNKVLLVDKGQPELHYIISDLGATFGKTGGFLSRSRNEPEDYVKAKFVEGVTGGEVKLAYSGKE